MSLEESVECLFSYGTLQREEVQSSTFGRTFTGVADFLPGCRLVMVEVSNPEFISASGSRYHRNVQFTGNESETIAGTVLEVTMLELRQADRYEAAANYVRIRRLLGSGRMAWVYVMAEAG